MTTPFRPLRAGELRQPIFLGRPVVTQDAAGGDVITWVEWPTWASIEPVKGREWMSGPTVKDFVDCKITLRVSPGWEPDAKWRVRDAVTDALYNIITVMMLPKLGAAECMAKTVMGNTDAR